MYKKFFIALIVLIGNVTAHICAAPGDLDTTFNPSGVQPGTLTTTIDGVMVSNNAYAVAIQADGKIVAVGEASVGGVTKFAVARFNTDGSLDTTFNSGGTQPGTVTTDIDNSTSSQGRGVAIQSDGKIVVAGFAMVGGLGKFGVARFNTNGTLDTTGFNSGGAQPGTLSTSIDGFSTFTSRGFAVAIQSDSKIVVAGDVTISLSGRLNFAVARLNTNGTLDTATFNSGGTQPGTVSTTVENSATNQGQGVALQTDGKIVIAGTVDIGGNDHFGVARFNTNGTLDTTTFNPGGAQPGTAATTVDNEVREFAKAVAIQADGKIVIAGIVTSSTPVKFGVARFNTVGTLDTTFNPTGLQPGTVATVIGSFTNNQGNALAIQTDSKIVVAGYTGIGGGNFNFAVARFNTDGMLDASFDTTPSGVLPGTVSTSIDNDLFNFGNGIAIQSDGKIVVAGQTSDTGGDETFGLARFTGDLIAPAGTTTTNLCALRLIEKYGPRL